MPKRSHGGLPGNAVSAPEPNSPGQKDSLVYVLRMPPDTMSSVRPLAPFHSFTRRPAQANVLGSTRKHDTRSAQDVSAMFGSFITSMASAFVDPPLMAAPLKTLLDHHATLF